MTRKQPVAWRISCLAAGRPAEIFIDDEERANHVADRLREFGATGVRVSPCAWPAPSEQRTGGSDQGTH